MDRKGGSFEDALPESFAKLIQTNGIPSDSEREVLLAAIAEPTTALRALREEISWLDRRLKTLIQEEKQLATKLKPYQAVVLPGLRNIPDDILREIFLACLPAHQNPRIDARKAPILLTHISRHTRHVAQSTSRLWATIQVPVGPRVTGELCDAVAEWLLRRSGECELTISVHGWLESAVAPDIMNTLIASARRWKKISLSGSFALLSRFLLPLCNFSELPCLESFALASETYLARGQDLQPVINSCALVNSAPELRDLRLDVVNWDGNYSEYNIRWNSLAHLSLGSENNPVKIGCALGILGMSSQLRTCKLHLTEGGDLVRVSVPYLTGISLSFEWQDDWWDSEEAMTIFADMHLPSLTCIAYAFDAEYSHGVPSPLNGLLRAAHGRIEHLRIEHLDGPSQLISFLQSCPRLVSLDLFNCPTCEDTSTLPASDIAIRAWFEYFAAFDVSNVAELLFPVLCPPGRACSPDRPLPPVQLCPALEYLSIRYQFKEASVDRSLIKAFLRERFWDLHVGRHPGYRRLRGLYVGVGSAAGRRGVIGPSHGAESFVEEVHAGLLLSLTECFEKGPDWWPWKEEPVF